MSKHTPGKWIFKPSSFQDTQTLEVSSEESPYWIAHVNWVKGDANARRIVQCVNVHDALVEALTRIVQAADECKRLPLMLKVQVNNARAALRQAEVEP